MNKTIEWFARNGVTANLLMVAILVAGIISLRTITLEVFPEMAFDLVDVSVVYNGAAPEEVEEAICIRIEEAVQDLEGINQITSVAAENVGNVSVEVAPGYSTRKLLEDIKTRVDGIVTFPEESEKPVVSERVNRRQVINVAVTGSPDERTLKSIAEEIREEIAALPEISQVELSAARPYEISIEVPEATLRQYGLTFDEVVRAVRLSSLDLPGGSIDTRGGEILLRTKGQAYRGHEFENIVLRSSNDGVRLKLGDIANINDGFADTDQFSRFDNEQTVLIQVFRVGNESALDVAAAVYAFVEEAQSRLPGGIKLTTWQDYSRVLKDRLNLLLTNGMMGFLLVFLALAFFMRLRLAMWVGVGMLLSFFGAFWLMPTFGVTINLLSLFAFILVLGIVVDDAIVVGENIYTHFEQGKSGVQAAIDGTKEVALPVVFAILTTLAAFYPLLNVPGNMGKVMKVIPIIVISTLLFSLIESLLVLPSHLSHLSGKEAQKEHNRVYRWWTSIQERSAAVMRLFAESRYKNWLVFTLKWRYVTIASCIGLLIVTLSLVTSGRIGFTFMPDVEADNVVALVKMPQGTPAEVTARVVSQLEESARQLRSEYSRSDQDAIEHMLATVGEQPFLANAAGPGNSGQPGQFSGSHLAEVNLQLVSAEERDVTSPELATRWRELTGTIAGAEEISFNYSLFNSGKAINIQLSALDYNTLIEATDSLKSHIAAYPGVFGLTDSYQDGKKEVKIDILPEGEALGLTRSDLARQVRQAFYGEEAQRIQRGRDEVRVMVRYPQRERTSIGDLENMRVRVAGGGEVPFSVTARVEEGRGFATINRTDRRRTVNVTADVDKTVANAEEIAGLITADYMPRLLQRFPGLSYEFGGQQQDQQDTLDGLKSGFIFALLIIYILLAIPFRSYSQPLIVMSAIPFGLIGAIWGHVFLGMDLSILSGFGVVALTGVVVNDSLVMVDFINRERERGTQIAEAVRDAGVSRFRPIILTSLTTFAGLTPLLLETSLQARFLIPMAISLAFGVLFATVITLILVPNLYFVLEDLKQKFGKKELTGATPA